MKLVTLEEYSGMNQPSIPASIIFCICLGCDMTKYQSFSFLLVDFVFAILCSAILGDRKMQTLFRKEF